MPQRIESYRDLIVWQQAMDLAVLAYETTHAWPRDERFGLTAQARRAATSVAANIAEGYGRESARSYTQFLKIAQGSLKELETHLIIAHRVGLLPQNDVNALLQMSESIGKLLRRLIHKLGID